MNRKLMKANCGWEDGFDDSVVLLQSSEKKCLCFTDHFRLPRPDWSEQPLPLQAPGRGSQDAQRTQVQIHERPLPLPLYG